MNTVDFRNFGGIAYYQGGETIWNFGRFASQAHVESVRRSLVNLYDEPQSFYDCAPHLRNYGVGKSINLHTIARQVLPSGIPSQYQNRGTCFPAGTPILMADNTEKPIESVVVGDEVITHTGAIKKVLAVGDRSYTGPLISITARNSGGSTKMTADHPVAIFPNAQVKGKHGYHPGPLQWTIAESIQAGDRVLMPIGPRGIRADHLPTQYIRVPAGLLYRVKVVASANVTELTVYNLEVDEDHSYVADCIAVHNCVSRGAKRIIDLVRCLAIYCGEGAVMDDLTSHAYIYGDCREHGNFLGNQDGAVGAWAAWTVANDGNILNRDCQDSDNNDSLAVEWGLRGVPANYKDMGRKHTVRRVILLKTFDEVRDFLTAGLGGVTVASDVGYTTTRDHNGMCQASGTWNHQMCYTGYDADQDALAQDQSWGPTQPDGPVFHCAGDACPSYTFGVSRDDATRQISQGDTWGYAWVAGWAAQDVTWRP